MFFLCFFGNDVAFFTIQCFCIVFPNTHKVKVYSRGYIF